MPPHPLCKVTVRVRREGRCRRLAGGSPAWGMVGAPQVRREREDLATGCPKPPGKKPEQRRAATWQIARHVNLAVAPRDCDRSAKCTPAGTGGRAWRLRRGARRSGGEEADGAPRAAVVSCLDTRHSFLDPPPAPRPPGVKPGATGAGAALWRRSTGFRRPGAPPSRRPRRRRGAVGCPRPVTQSRNHPFPALRGIPHLVDSEHPPPAHRA